MNVKKHALKNALLTIMQLQQDYVPPIALIPKLILTTQQMLAKNAILHAKDAQALPTMTAWVAQNTQWKRSYSKECAFFTCPRDYFKDKE